MLAKVKGEAKGIKSPYVSTFQFLMPTYSAYALSIDSDLRFPGFQPVAEEPDVSIRVGDVPATPDQPVEDYKMYRVEGGHYLKLSGTGAIYGEDGQTLIVEPESGVDSDLLRWFVLGQGFRMLLHQREYVVLHASATVIDGRAVAFLGESGRGKSTTTAACYAAGYPVLTDDVAAVNPDTCLVKPGFPHVKLDSESASIIEADVAPVEERGDLSRQYYTAPDGSRTDPVPLGGLYFLEDGEEVRISPLPPSEQPYRLMCSSASAYHSASDDEVETHLDECVQLASKVPVKQLERPREFDVLPDVVRAIGADLRETPTPEQAKE